MAFIAIFSYSDLDIILKGRITLSTLKLFNLLRTLKLELVLYDNSAEITIIKSNTPSKFLR